MTRWEGFFQALRDCWFVSHKNPCGQEEWEIILGNHSTQLNFELYHWAMPMCFRRTLCSQMLFACFKINPPAQNRSDRLWTPCKISLPDLNMHTQQLKNKSIPDVPGKSWNFLIPHTNGLAGPKLLIRGSVREAAWKTGWERMKFHFNCRGITFG